MKFIVETMMFKNEQGDILQLILPSNPKQPPVFEFDIKFDHVQCVSMTDVVVPGKSNLERKLRLLRVYGRDVIVIEGDRK